MNDTLNFNIVTKVTTQGVEESTSKTTAYNKTLEQIETNMERVGAKPLKINTSSLTSSVKQLETIKSLLNSMTPGDATIGTSISALEKSGTLSMLPTGTQSVLQEFGKMQNIVNDPSAFKNLNIVLDTMISSLKTAVDVAKQANNAAEQTKDSVDAVGGEISDNTSKQKQFNDELSKSPGFVNQLKNRFNMLNAVQLVYLFRTVRRVTTGLVESVANAAAYEESLNLYTVALGDYTKQAIEWKDRITDALKLDPKEVMQYTGAFYNFAHSMGVSSDAAYTMATNLTQLTYDLASYLNISDEAAQTKLQSAMAGQSRAVATVGIPLQIASLQELADNLDEVAKENDDLALAEEVKRLGIKKSVADMTQAEKTYLRYIQLMRKTEKMQGDLGRTLITPANAIRMLKTQLSLLSQAIGQVLTPIIMAAMPYMIAFTNVLTNAAKRLAEFLGYKLADVDYSNVFENINNELGKTGKEADGAGKKIKNGLAPFDELNQVMSETSGKKGDGYGGDITDVLEKYITGYDMLKDLNTDLTDKAKALEGTMTNFLKIAGGFAAVYGIYRTVSGITKGIDNVAKTGDRIKKIAGWFGIGKSKKGSDALNDVLKETDKVSEQADKSSKSIGLPSWKTLGKGLLELAAVTTAVIAYVEVLGLFMRIPGFRENIVDGTWALKEVFFGIAQIALPLVGVGAAIVVLGNVGVGTMTQGLLGLAEVILGTEAVVLAAGWVSSSDTTKSFISGGIKTIQDIFWGIADVALPLIGVTTALAGLGLATAGTGGAGYLVILAGLGALAEIIIGTGAVVAAIGGIKQIPGVTWIIDEGFALLNQLAHGIGELAGVFISAIGEGVSDALPAIGTNLSSFVENASPFFDTIKNIDSTAMEGAKNLGNTILTLTSAGLIDGIARWLGFGESSLDNFGKQLPEFGKSMKKYSDNISGIDAKTVNESAIAAKALVEISKQIPNEGGMVSWFVGDNKLVTFAEYLPKFGDNLAKYAANIKGVDSDLITKSANAAASLVEVTKNIPNQGGLVAWFTGDNKIDDYSMYLPGFGRDIYGYANYMKLVDVENMKKGTEAVKMIVDITRNLPNQNGVAQWFTGQYNLGDFSNDLIIFGSNFKKYYDKVSGIDYTKMQLIILNLNDITDMFVKVKSNKLNPIISEFSQSLSSLGGAFETVKLNRVTQDNLIEFGKKVGEKIKSGIKQSLKGTVSIKNMFGQETSKYDISLFANGGPLNTLNSGDLFAMNENGRAEYMASIGNRTAVVNQDQMVQSLAMVITNAMSNMGFGNNQKGDTIVYIGNKKVYEGQGEYQNRENDRYGTSVVRV